MLGVVPNIVGRIGLEVTVDDVKLNVLFGGVTVDADIVVLILEVDEM